MDFLEVPMNRDGRRAFYWKNWERIRACTAAFAVSDVYAAEFMQFLSEWGIAVPEEMSVVGFDDNALCETCFPRLTTVGQDAAERAKMAVRALKRLWDGDGESTEVMPVKLIIRDSVSKSSDVTFGGNKIVADCMKNYNIEEEIGRGR